MAGDGGISIENITKYVDPAAVSSNGYSISASKYKNTNEEDVSSSIPAAVQVNSWKLSNHPSLPVSGANFLSQASITIADNVMTITGEIPNLSTENVDYLKVHTYEYGTEHKGEEILIDISSGINGVYNFTSTGVPIEEYLDIVNGSVTINGNQVTLVMTLRELPDVLTFNKSTIPKDYLEYEWGVYIGTNINK